MIKYSNFLEPQIGVVSEPTIITDGNSFAEWDFEVGITKNGSNQVTKWTDRLLSANDLNPISSATPAWSADGVTTNAAQLGLGTGAKTLNQAVTYYVVCNPNAGVAGKTIVDGNGTLSCAIYMNNTVINISPYAGTLGTGVNITPNAWVILAFGFNGASGFYQINNNAPVYGNWGAGNPSGITLGRSSNITFKKVLVRKMIDSVADRNAIINYYNIKYGIY